MQQVSIYPPTFQHYGVRRQCAWYQMGRARVPFLVSLHVPELLNGLDCDSVSHLYPRAMKPLLDLATCLMISIVFICLNWLGCSIFTPQRKLCRDRYINLEKLHAKLRYRQKKKRQIEAEFNIQEAESINT